MSIESFGYDLNSKLFENRKAEVADNFQKVVEKKTQKKDNKENAIQTDDKYIPSKKEAPVEKAEKEVKTELKTKPASEVLTGGSKEVDNGIDSFKKSADAAPKKVAEVAPTPGSAEDDDEPLNPKVENNLGNLQALLLNYAQVDSPKANPEAK